MAKAFAEFVDKGGAVHNVLADGADETGVSDSRSAFATTNARSGAKVAPKGVYRFATDFTFGEGWVLDAGCDLKPDSGVTIDASSALRLAPDATLYDNDSGDYFVPSQPDANPTPGFLHVPWKSRYQRAIRTKAPVVVCYGDSNTRYYQGDTSTAGPVQNSYGMQLRAASLRWLGIAGADVQVEGYPGNRAEYGDTNYASIVTPYSPNAVVLGWGTNNVKDTTYTLAAYLTSMESLIEKVYADGALPIVLTIPDYHSTYATDGVTGRHRIKVWNTHLAALAARYNVPVVDTYSMFNNWKVSQAATWYNEATNWRHYSAYAGALIAAEIARILAEHSAFPFAPSDYRWGLRTTDPLLTLGGGGGTQVAYALSDAFRFSAIQLVNSTSDTLTFRFTGDQVVIGFYPRSDAGEATITIKNGATGATITTATFDTYGATTDSLFLPVTKYSYRPATGWQEYEVEVTPAGTQNASSTGYDLYVNALAAGRLIA